MSRKKITVVGAGNVGGTLAQRLAERGYADVVLIDIVEGLPQGKALDILESLPVLGIDVQVTGTNSYEETANSDLVVITSGIARRPGMSRDDLITTNQGIVASVTEQVVRYSPNTIIICVTNPLDAMCHVALETSGFPKQRVIGQSGVLDTARFRTFLAQELQVSVQDVHAYVLGGHGDTMVPLVDTTNIAGVPVRKLIPEDRLQQIVQRARDGGAEIVNLLKTGSAFYAPSAATAQMVDAILLDKHQILPTCVYLQGEYGINDLYVGVPVKLGASGVEQIIELDLSAAEREALHKSASAVRELVEVLHRARE
ncbi:MAG: malate dehydrogenase [Chloroflexi bacterium]|nr:malate dehydrogenase [Chloroflexota bacterium]